MNYWCNICNKKISENEYKYSNDKFNRALCRDHQKRDLNKETTSLKRGPTKEAKKLGELLKQKGWNVEFEKYDGYKHIDIAIVESKVNLEIDGAHHNLSPKQALADLQRTYHSFKKGYITLRIPNCLVKEEMIYKTAHFVDSFLDKGAEDLDKEQSEAKEKGSGLLDWIWNKINEE